jgi:hypothetical protein
MNESNTITLTLWQKKIISLIDPFIFTDVKTATNQHLLIHTNITSNSRRISSIGSTTMLIYYLTSNIDHLASLYTHICLISPTARESNNLSKKMKYFLDCNEYTIMKSSDRHIAITFISGDDPSTGVVNKISLRFEVLSNEQLRGLGDPSKSLLIFHNFRGLQLSKPEFVELFITLIEPEYKLLFITKTIGEEEKNIVHNTISAFFDQTWLVNY